jgi:hypothetical protein
MKDRFRARWALAAGLASILLASLAGVAAANNLDKRTALNAAREVARRDCRATAGCEEYKVVSLNRVSRHKAVGKIAVFSLKDGERFVCRRQVVVKLDHETGKLFYATSKRRCENLGPV